MEQRSAQILVVDDEAAIRLTMEILLRRQGYAVTTAESGAQALGLLEQQAFDLMLLDLKMPGLDGVAVAERAQVLRPSTGILILTGSSAIEGTPDVPRPLDVDFMLKTASPQEVLARVAELLARR